MGTYQSQQEGLVVLMSGGLHVQLQVAGFCCPELTLQ